MSINNFTIGCDPEIFLTKNGQGVSAYSLIPGSKESPHKTEGGAIQPDGFAAEFNTDPVKITDWVSFNGHITKQLQILRQTVPKELSLTIKPVMEFSKKHIDEQPDAAKELGCDPDFNAYTMEKNPRPNADDVLFRSGAGHIHIGWGADIPVDNPEHMEICANFVKILDATVGLFMTVIDREPRRRELYGKAGAFRPKPYGVEYRTPSNAWIGNRDRRQVVFSLVNYAVRQAIAGKDVRLISGYSEKTVQEIIDTGEHQLADTIMRSMASRIMMSSLYKSITSKIEE